MTVSLGGQVLGKVVVDQYEVQTYNYFVAGKTGAQTLTIAFSNQDQGEQPYGRMGFDKDLFIVDATVSAAKKKAATTDTKSAIELATTDSYVLDPYEYAAALSYMYTGSTPDETLLAAAKMVI